VAEIEGRNEDLSAKEGQLRIANKNLREELRKVQAGILLSEKSRNPGVGYFSSFSQAGSPSASNVNLAVGARSPPLPSAPGSAVSQGPTMNGAVDNDSRARRESTTSLASEGAVARAGGGSSDDEALNFEYIRNVILQFLEHKEMRVSLSIRLWSVSSGKRLTCSPFASLLSTYSRGISLSTASPHLRLSSNLALYTCRNEASHFKSECMRSVAGFAVIYKHPVSFIRFLLRPFVVQ
jgi:hypothetical protein